MGYSLQTFVVDQVHTSAQMNQTEFNIRDHLHGQDGVSAVSVARVSQFRSTVPVTGDGANFTLISSFAPTSGQIGTEGGIRWTGTFSSTELDDMNWQLRLSYGSEQAIATLTAQPSITALQFWGGEILFTPNSSDPAVQNVVITAPGASLVRQNFDSVAGGVSSQDSSIDVVFAVEAKRGAGTGNWTCENWLAEVI